MLNKVRKVLNGLFNYECFSQAAGDAIGYRYVPSSLLKEILEHLH